MTTLAQDPGVTAVTDPSEPGKQQERSRGVPIGREAFASNPEWAYLADLPVPSFVLPPIIGQAGFAAFDAKAIEADRNAAEFQRQLTDPWGNPELIGGWTREAQLHTLALHAQVPIPISAPAAVDGKSAAAGADSISGPGSPAPREPGPAPAGDEAA